MRRLYFLLGIIIAFSTTVSLSSCDSFLTVMQGVNAGLGALTGQSTTGTVNYDTYSQSSGNSYNTVSSSGSSASEKTKCKRCLGSGNCSSLSATANKYYCHGSGKCGYCNGKGWLQKYGQTIECSACINGKCHYCNGTGKCSDCNGKGYI